MTNYLTLSLDQKIAATGGTVSLQSYLYRLDQFDYKEKTYNSQPLRISYTQSLRAFNSLKWEKETAPVEYQIAERNYISALQDVTIRVASLFFSVLAAQSNYKQSLATVEDRERLYEVSKSRLNLTTTTKSEVLQMELSLLNARMAVKKNKITLDDAMYDLFSYLRLTDYENAELMPPYTVPDILVNADDVLQKAIKNSSHGLDQKLQMLEAQKTLAQAKANKGLQMTLSSEIGFSQTGNTFGGAYSNLKTIDVSNFDTSNVTNMYCMFYNCQKLETIYGPEKFVTDKVTSSDYMFSSDSKLVGGAGTKQTASKHNHEYAHMDGGETNPGYFTKKDV